VEDVIIETDNWHGSFGKEIKLTIISAQANPIREA
jgi:hypothetical protein